MSLSLTTVPLVFKELLASKISPYELLNQLKAGGYNSASMQQQLSSPLIWKHYLKEFFPERFERYAR